MLYNGDDDREEKPDISWKIDDYISLPRIPSQVPSQGHSEMGHSEIGKQLNI